MKKNLNILQFFRVCSLKSNSSDFVFHKQFVAILFICFASLQVVAQQYYPVVARFTQLPPYPVYLADFSNQSQTNLAIKVQQNDRAIATRAFRIKVYIEGQGVQIQGADVVQGEKPLTLRYGEVYDLPASDVANYFKQYNLKVSPAQYSRPFNEGTFRFGVEIIDDITKRPLSGIQWSNFVWLTINEPPVWTMPQNDITITPTIPQNITFQWAPRHANVSDVEYEFTITELMLNKDFKGNIQNLFLAQPFFYKTRTRATTLSYNATLPPLVPGRTYAYRVQAIAKRGMEEVGVFRNNGFSEIQSFKYGEPLFPPTNLKMAWADNNKDANLDWKGEDNHKKFEVEIREKGAKGILKTLNTQPQSTGLYNTLKLSDLDPSKSYEARVTGIGANGEKAVSTIIDLKVAPMPVKIENLLLKGKVNWAYVKPEEGLVVQGNIIRENKTKVTIGSTVSSWISRFTQTNTSAALPEETPKRDTQLKSFGSTEAGASRYPLDKANVTLLGSNEELTIDNYKTKKSQGFLTVATNANGEYEIDCKSVKLSNTSKFLYVLAEYQDTVFAPTLVKIDVQPSETGTKNIQDLMLLANTIRYEPKIIIDKSSLHPAQTVEDIKNNIEEIGLYRMKSAIDKYAFLKQEGNIKGTKGTITYNKDVYVKVADFGNTTTASQLFYNKPYNDKFVLRVKEKGRTHVVFPVNDIDSLKEKNYAHVIDHFNYSPPKFKISGFVSRSGSPNAPIKGSSVYFSSNGMSIGGPAKTDEKGAYEFEIPINMAKNSKIKVEAVDPMNVKNARSKEITYEVKDDTASFVLAGASYYLEGRVMNRNGEKISGATVNWNKQTTKTDGEGYFSFAADGEEPKGSFEVMFDGYRKKIVSAKAFSNNKVAIYWDEDHDRMKERLYRNSKIVRTDKQKDDYYANNFKNNLNKLTNRFYNYDSLALDDEVIYRVVTYTDNRNSLGLRNQLDSVSFTSALLQIDGKEVTVPAAQLVEIENKKLEVIAEYNPFGKAKNQILKGGYFGKTYESKLAVKVLKQKSIDGTPAKEFWEENLEIPIPKRTNPKDTVLISLKLKPTEYFYGVVYDSTTFISGIHDPKDTVGINRTVRRPGDSFRGLDSVKVSVSGSEAMTDANGHFKILVPKGQEFAVEVSYKGKRTFATTKYAITPAMVRQHSPQKGKDGIISLEHKRLYMVRSIKIPEFTTLMGFDIKVDKGVQNSSETYLITGKLKLNTGKLTPGKHTNIFDAGKTTELTFRDIVVKQDPKTKTNAITMANSINFVETEAQILLFGYAPITLEGNHAGEPHIRLQHLDMKGGAAANEGKIGASKMKFTQKKMANVEFGQMSLEVKEPEKEKKFGKFDNKIKKDATKEKDGTLATANARVEEQKNNIAQKEEAIKAASGAEKVKLQRELKAMDKDLANAKVAQQTALIDTKDVKTAANQEEKEKIEKEKKKLEKDKEKLEKEAKKLNKEGAVPDKEPLLVAFAPQNLEELADTKEFSIKFPNVATKGDTKKLFSKKDSTAKEDKYKDYVSFGLGSFPIIGKGIPFSMPKVGINPEKAVLKKSGISMSGVFFLPAIWSFVGDKDNPPTIEKLEIDKKFNLKLLSIGKSNPDKKEIVAFGIKNWMCYINTIQIYHNFRGFGAGGTFNTDKENYINIESFGLSVIDKQVYPNVVLSTPEDGFKFSKLRFKTVGKKSISFKGNPDEKSYEVEGSLRIEWDDKETTNLATATHDKFGKPLSQEALMKNQNDANDKEHAELKKKREERQAAEEKIAKEKDDFMAGIKKEKDDIDAEEEKLKKEYNELISIDQEHVRKRKEQKIDADDYWAKLPDVKKDLLNKGQILAKKIEDFGTRKAKWEKAKDAKEAEFDKKITERKKQEEAAAATAAAAPTEKKEEKKAEGSAGKTWKDRVFPIEVQYFKWTTTGKFVISAGLSQDALSFGPINVKVRRVVFARGGSLRKKEMDDLLKLNEDEVKKMNGTSRFNNANTTIGKDSIRTAESATSAASQRSKEGATVESMSLKQSEDKVAANNPNIGWALGFAGGIEVTTKSVNVDSDVSFYIADFDNSGGHTLTMNEIMLKIDATAFRAFVKVKLATSGKKIGFEGEGEFEGAKIKAAIALKFYKLYDDRGNGTGIELGALLKVSTGPTGIPMGPITWTALGGGFELNTADKKFAVKFLGDARGTGVPEKAAQFKKIIISLEFDGKACGAVPVLRGSAEVWSGLIDPSDPKEKKLCSVNVDLDFCRALVVIKLDCELPLKDNLIKVDALAFVGKSVGFFIGAKVRLQIFSMNANGLLVLGIGCDTQHQNTPKELGIYTSALPKMYFANDNRTISAFYVGLDISYELRKNGGASAFGIKLVSYNLEVLLKGRMALGINFTNGNFEILSKSDLKVDGNANILGFSMYGKLNAGLEIGGGYDNERGGHFRAFIYANIEVGAGAYQGQPCNDFSITGILWCRPCIACCLPLNEYGWVKRKACRLTGRVHSIPYPCGGRARFIKLCLGGQLGVSYQKRGVGSGWRFVAGGK
jgi:hypothetical protein